MGTDFEVTQAQDEYLEGAIQGAAECLLWQASDVSEDGGNGFPISDGGNEYSEQVIAEVPYLTEMVTSFVMQEWDVLQRAGVDAFQCGHDLILTANGHGAGFWDRGLGKAGGQLTEAAHGFSMDAEFALDEDGDVVWLMVDNTVLVDELGESGD